MATVVAARSETTRIVRGADHDHAAAHRVMTDAQRDQSPAQAGPVVAHAFALSTLDTLDPAVRDFLRQTSVLTVLDAARCDELIERPGSRAVLEGLERQGVVSRDAGASGRYRLPALMREALAADLAACLGQAGIRDRYRRAGDILQSAGDWWGAAWAFAHAGDEEALDRLSRRRAGRGGSDADRVGAPGRRPATLRAGRRMVASTTVAAPRIAMHLLGTFEIVEDRVPLDLSGLRPRVRAVLQYLALHADTYVHRDVLAAVLWPEADVETGRRGVQVAVSALRSVLQPGLPRRSTLLPRRGDAYVLALTAHGSSDVLDLDAQLARARRARAMGERATAIAAWREVARLYRGDLLLEQGNAEWVVAERDRLKMAVADALELLGRHLVGTDATDEGIAALRRALDLDPFRDGTWRTLVETHESLGDVSAAAAARSRHRRVLVDLGVLEEPIDLRERSRKPRNVPSPH